MKHVNAGRYSTAGRLYLVVGLFILIIVCLFALMQVQNYVLSSVRAYVTGEGLYAKGHKQAVYHLERYSASYDQAEYDQFLVNISIPLGDQLARKSLIQDPPDVVRATRGFLAAQNHPEDIELMISLFLNFGEFGEMKNAIQIWTQADAAINELVKLGLQLHKEIQGQQDSSTIEALRQEIFIANETVTELEDRFSFTLGRGARQLTVWTERVSIAVTLILIFVGGLISRTIVNSVRDTQQRLQDSEARFRRVVESNIIGIAFFGAGGEIQDANEAFLRTLERTKDELPELNWIELTPEAYREADRQAGREIEAQGYSNPYEKALFRADGVEVPVLVGSARTKHDPNSGVSFVLDISERQRLEEQEEKVKRMEAIGTLVGGIAHDFNNNLSAMLGNLELARQLASDDTALAGHLDTMTQLSQRAADIVKQLMVFASKDLVRMEVCDLGEYLKKVFDAEVAEIGTGIDIALVAHPGPMPFKGDTLQLRMILHNLIDNALYSVKESASPAVRIELNLVVPDDGLLEDAPGLTNCDVVQLSVSDNGLGMDAEQQDRAFEPFFTTRPRGEGVGLGLSAVHGAAKTHGGTVRIESEPGEGTSVHVFLPLNRRQSVFTADAQAKRLAD